MRSVPRSTMWASSRAHPLHDGGRHERFAAGPYLGRWLTSRQKSPMSLTLSTTEPNQMGCVAKLLTPTTHAASYRDSRLSRDRLSAVAPVPGLKPTTAARPWGGRGESTWGGSRGRDRA